MIGYPDHVARWMESENRALHGFGISGEPSDPDDLLREIATALTEYGTHLLDYEHRYIRQHYPERLCPECQSVVRMGVTIDTRRGLRWRHCPECRSLPADGGVESEEFEMYIDRMQRRRERR